MSNCVICGKPTKDQRRTCSDKCLMDRQIEIKRQWHDGTTKETNKDFRRFLKDKEREDIERVVYDL